MERSVGAYDAMSPSRVCHDASVTPSPTTTRDVISKFFSESKSHLQLEADCKYSKYTAVYIA